MNRNSSQSGFSLVELMIAVGIVGLLSAMVQANMMPKVRRAIAILQVQTISSGLIKKREIDQISLCEMNNWECYSNEGCNGGNKASCTKMDTAMKSFGFPGAIQTPWGGYFWIDANQWEFGATTMCRADVIGFWDGDRKEEVSFEIPPRDCTEVNNVF